jgi:CubicO group peptidase (beta-lactamase class C family)
MMKLFTCIFTLILLTLSIAAQTLTTRLDSLFTVLANEDRLNGNVLVAEKGKIVYQKSFGLADIENTKPNTLTTAFQLASLSKPFTAIAILQLAEKGKLNIDDTYARYFPAFPYPNITVAQLLSHSSGLSDQDLAQAIRAFEKRQGRHHTNADLVPLLAGAKAKLKLNPGEKWWYSNLGYELLANLVEKQSGLSFGLYVQKNILKPAGMEQTYLRLSPKDNRPYQANNYDYPNRYSPQRQRIDLTGDDYTEGTFGHSNMYSTTGDLFKLTQSLLSGRLIGITTLKRAITGTQLSGGKPNDVWLNIGGLGEAVDGLGWFILKNESTGKIVFHAGGMSGAVTILLFNHEKQQAVIILDNTGSEGIYKNAQNALRILNNEPIQTAKRNLAKLYGRVLISKGTDAAASLLLSLRGDTTGYILNENDLNNLGYALLEDKHKEQALECFKLNCLLFSQSDNVFNSYGDALEQSGRVEEAARMYRRSIELNPENEDSKKALQRLQNEN